MDGQCQREADMFQLDQHGMAIGWSHPTFHASNNHIRAPSGPPHSALELHVTSNRTQVSLCQALPWSTSGFELRDGSETSVRQNLNDAQKCCAEPSTRPTHAEWPTDGGSLQGRRSN
jgi:hypothetical protein